MKTVPQTSTCKIPSDLSFKGESLENSVATELQGYFPEKLPAALKASSAWKLVWGRRHPCTLHARLPPPIILPAV